MWQQGQDVSKPDLLAKLLQQHFREDEVKKILESANSASYKQLLNDKTKEALDRGAFGCPWFFVRNSKGEEEPFFGSDRSVKCPLRLSISTDVWFRRQLDPLRLATSAELEGPLSRLRRRTNRETWRTICGNGVGR